MRKRLTRRWRKVIRSSHSWPLHRTPLVTIATIVIEGATMRSPMMWSPMMWSPMGSPWGSMRSTMRCPMGSPWGSTMRCPMGSTIVVRRVGEVFRGRRLPITLLMRILREMTTVIKWAGPGSGGVVKVIEAGGGAVQCSGRGH